MGKKAGSKSSVLTRIFYFGVLRTHREAKRGGGGPYKMQLSKQITFTEA